MGNSSSLTKNRPKEKVNQGNYELEISTCGELDLQKSLIICDKNPGHQLFIPANQISLIHLPNFIRSNVTLEWMKGLAKKTVKMTLSYISPSRAKHLPLSGQAGQHILSVGSGYVTNIFSPGGTETLPCPFEDCRENAGPHQVYGYITVVTAAHVVFDDVEARHTTVDFFYDSSADKAGLTSARGVRLGALSPDGDSCEVLCVTHDGHLMDQIKRLVSDKEASQLRRGCVREIVRALATDRGQHELSYLRTIQNIEFSPNSADFSVIISQDNVSEALQTMGLLHVLDVNLIYKTLVFCIPPLVTLDWTDQVKCERSSNGEVVVTIGSSALPLSAMGEVLACFKSTRHSRDILEFFSSKHQLRSHNNRETVVSDLTSLNSLTVRSLDEKTIQVKVEVGDIIPSLTSPDNILCDDLETSSENFVSLDFLLLQLCRRFCHLAASLQVFLNGSRTTQMLEKWWEALHDEVKYIYWLGRTEDSRYALNFHDDNQIVEYYNDLLEVLQRYAKHAKFFIAETQRLETSKSVCPLPAVHSNHVDLYGLKQNSGIRGKNYARRYVTLKRIPDAMEGLEVTIFELCKANQDFGFLLDKGFDLGILHDRLICPAATKMNTALVDCSRILKEKRSNYVEHGQPDFADDDEADFVLAKLESLYLGWVREIQDELQLQVDVLYKNLDALVAVCQSKRSRHQNNLVEIRTEPQKQLAFHISHPHGQSKQVTFGTLTNYKTAGGFYKPLYTAATCPGSSGGPVWVLPESGLFYDVYGFPHSGRHGDSHGEGCSWTLYASN